MLPPKNSLADWAGTIAETAKRFHNAVVELSDPAQSVTEPWDPNTGTGGESVTPVLASLKCRIIILTTPNNFSTETRTGTIRTLQVEFDGALYPGNIPEGYQIKIINGDDNPALVTGKYVQVQDATSASLMALRTITCKRES